MKFSSRRAGLAFFSAFAAAALVVAPVTADTPISEAGATGFHALNDTQSTPGVACRYKRVTPSPGGYDYEAKLNTIVVMPPRVRAHTGTQKVGWLFVVQRAPYTDGFGAWSTKYVSPLQTRLTNVTTNAAFDQMSVDVTVPNQGYDDGPLYAYRVNVLMFWYRAAGSVSGSSAHQVSNYKRVLRPAAWSQYSYTEMGQCWAWEYLVGQYPAPGQRTAMTR